MLEGSCLCGAVRYSTADEPLFGVICCCDQCQHATGSGHLPLIGVPRAGFAVRGETRGFTSADGHRGPVTRHFCPTCGSQLFGTASQVPLITLITVGSLAPPKPFVPTFAIHVAEKCAWDVLPEKVELWLGPFGDADYQPEGDSPSADQADP